MYLKHFAHVFIDKLYAIYSVSFMLHFSCIGWLSHTHLSHATEMAINYNIVRIFVLLFHCVFRAIADIPAIVIDLYIVI